MKTILVDDRKIPEFDTHINNWIDSFEQDISRVPHCIGIADFVFGQYVIYRKIEASRGELNRLIYFLHAIGMVDVIMKQKDKDLHRIFGYPRSYYQ